MKSGSILLPLLFVPMLAGCTSTSSDGHASGTNAFETHINGNLHFDVEDGVLVAKAPGRADARVNADGDLNIGGKAVAITPTQQALLKRYHDKVVDVRADGIAIGKAGVAMGMSAVSNVVDSLLSDKNKGNDPDMQANGKKVEIAAQRLCEDMLQVKSLQGDIAAQLPVFAPYAVFNGEVHCDKRVTVSTSDSDPAAASSQAR